MVVPHLGDAPYFSIPPLVTEEELEAKLDEVGLSRDKKVRAALELSKNIHWDQLRNSTVPVLDEHIYPATLAGIAYQEHQKMSGNPEFSRVHPEGPIITLLHDVPDDGGISKTEIKKGFGQRIVDLLWPITDDSYRDARSYDEKIARKFETLRKCQWPTQIGGLADRISNSLCYYTKPYIDELTGKPTDIMRRQLRRDKHIVLPFAREVSPDFFYQMFAELITHYRKKYPIPIRGIFN